MLSETPKPNFCPLNSPYIHAYNNLKELQHLSTVPMQSGIISTRDPLLCSLTVCFSCAGLTPHFKPEVPVAAESARVECPCLGTVPALCRVQAPLSCGSCTLKHCLILLGCSHSFSSHCPWITKETRISSTGGFGGSFSSSLCSW